MIVNMMKIKLDKKQLLLILAAVLVIMAGFLIIMLEDNSWVPVKKVIGNECVKAGCSGQLCVNKGDQPVITTCEWKEEYGCYKLATCETQANGKCGFTWNTEFRQCMAKLTGGIGNHVQNITP